MKLLFFTSLLVSLLLCSSSFLADATVATAPAPAAAPIAGSCNAMCSTRCTKSGIPKRCFKYCCICCNKCKCVPSGTYGNKSECPCYRDMVNSKGKPKCP